MKENSCFDAIFASYFILLRDFMDSQSVKGVYDERVNKNFKLSKF